MSDFLYKHFPKTKKSWNSYTKAVLPLVLGSMLFALNGFIDNFMVGHIDQGGAALAAVNAWTNIFMGVLVGISGSGSIVLSQYLGSNEIEKAKMISRFRFFVSLIVAFIFLIFMEVMPDFFIKVFLKNDSSTNMEKYNVALNNARDYSHIITISWILMSLSFNYGNQFRETGHAKIAMLWGIGTTLINITLNATLMYGVGMGVEGAAYASVAGRALAVFVAIIYSLKVEIPFFWKPWTFWKVEWQVIKDFLKNWFIFMSFASVQAFVTFRAFFYDAAYSVGSEQNKLGIGLSANSVLALTGAIMAVFTTMFSALASLSARFVGTELGRNNIEKAKIVGHEIKGFSFVVALFSSLLLFIISACVPYMKFLSETQTDSLGVVVFDGSKNLIQVRNALWIIALWYPIWIWFTTSFRVGSQGGKGLLFAINDLIISGPIQLGWAAIIAYVFVPNSDFLQHNFWLTYFIFFTSDLLKLITQEIVFYKKEWAFKISKEKVKEEESLSTEISELSIRD